MGKLRKKMKIVKPSTTEDVGTKIPNEVFNIPMFFPESTKPSDLASVRSFKSMKNKFGIQKQITKIQKLKLKKEILKQKIDVIKNETNNTKKSKKKLKVGKKHSLSLSKESLPMEGFSHTDGKDDTTHQQLKFKRDEDEEYMKLGNKIKGISNQRIRRKQRFNDVHTLKELMKHNKNHLRNKIHLNTVT